MNGWLLKFDGGCTKNPGGTATYGFILYKDDIELSRGSGIIGEGELMSNNLAEFYAVYKGLTKFNEIATNNTQILVLGDSNLVIQVLSGKWRAHQSKLYYQVFLKAKSSVTNLLLRNIKVKFQWIPREENQECDSLADIKEIIKDLPLDKQTKM